MATLPFMNKLVVAFDSGDDNKYREVKGDIVYRFCDEAEMKNKRRLAQYVHQQLVDRRSFMRQQLPMSPGPWACILSDRRCDLFVYSGFVASSYNTYNVIYADVFWHEVPRRQHGRSVIVLDADAEAVVQTVVSIWHAAHDPTQDMRDFSVNASPDSACAICLGADFNDTPEEDSVLQPCGLCTCLVHKSCWDRYLQQKCDSGDLNFILTGESGACFQCRCTCNYPFDLKTGRIHEFRRG